MSIRARLERLERRLRPTGPAGGINWANLGRRREDIVPDGILDWDVMFRLPEAWSAENCPVERAITAPLSPQQQARAIGYLAGIAREAIETGTLAARLEMLESVVEGRKTETKP